MSQRVECQANERNLTDRQQEAGGQQTSHTPPTSDPNSAHRFVKLLKILSCEVIIKDINIDASSADYSPIDPQFNQIIAIGLVFADSLDIPRGFTANVFLTDEANILNNPSVSDNFSRIDHLNSIKQQISKSLPQVSGEKLQILVSSNEKQMLESFFTSVQLLNPDFLIAFDCEKLAIGYIMRRSEFIFSPHLNDLLPSSKRNSKSVSIFLGRSPDPTSLVSSHLPSHAVQDPKNIDSPHDIDEEIDSVSDASHSSSSSAESSRVDLRHKVIRSIDAQQQFPGRIVLSVWRLISRDHKLRETSLSECLQLVLNKRVPHFDHSTLTSLVLGSGRRLKSKENLIFALSYLLKLCILNVEMISKMNSIPKISTFARIYGNQFQSYQRGSQYQVESVMLRQLKLLGMIAPSPSSEQRNSMPSLITIPLTLEPQSSFYSDPIIVLDFQSLYPSIIIAYNYCYSTCLGQMFGSNPKSSKFKGSGKNCGPPRSVNMGALSLDFRKCNLPALVKHVHFSPVNVAFVNRKINEGFLVKILKRLLQCRILTKLCMKHTCDLNEKVNYDLQQLGIKLLSNVIYGYTSAGFSGRMPCSDVADSILSMAVKIVQDSAKYINSEFKQYSCEVVYGDTDSLFIQCRHKTLDEAFKIVGEMIKGINSLFPWPIKIKFEKIYMPSFLITKKRYAGLAFEKPPSSPESPGVFDAKGIETVRKNSCLLVANSVEKILMKIFDTKSRIFAEKCIRQEINRILSNNFQVEEMILHAELKPHTSVCTGAHSHRLPIHIIISKLRLQNAYLSPTFGQRLPYIIVNPSGNSETEPLYRLIHPLGAINDLHRIDITEINTVYYLTNLLLPALERILSLFHINVFAIYYDHVSDFSIESSKQASGHPIHSQRGLSIRVFEEDSRKFNEHSKLKSSNLQKNIEANAICCDCSGNDFIWRYCGSKSCQIWLKRYTF